MTSDLSVALRLAIAAVLAIVFVAAGLAKLLARRATTDDFAALGLPQPRLLALLVPIVELVVAGLLVVVPWLGGISAFGLLAVFTAFLVPVVRSGAVVSCACFGGARSSPVSGIHIVRNVLMMAAAVAATTLDGWLPTLIDLE